MATQPSSGGGGAGMSSSASTSGDTANTVSLGVNTNKFGPMSFTNPVAAQPTTPQGATSTGMWVGIGVGILALIVLFIHRK